MAELARIRKERAEENARKQAEEAATRQQQLQAEVATGNPLLNQLDFQVPPAPRQWPCAGPAHFICEKATVHKRPFILGGDVLCERLSLGRIGHIGCARSVEVAVTGLERHSPQLAVDGFHLSAREVAAAGAAAVSAVLGARSMHGNEQADPCMRQAAQAIAALHAARRHHGVGPDYISEQQCSACTAHHMMLLQVKRRWDDDVVFRNQTRGEPKVQKRFINDTIRNDFHRRFLHRYIR